MKVKLLKRLRKKYCSKIGIKNWDLSGAMQQARRYFTNRDIKAHIKRNKLWYKLLTTLTHKKDVDKT
jgi:hypothetical protein